MLFTYRDLLKQLKELPDEELSQTVTFATGPTQDPDTEYLPIGALKVVERGNGVLDDGHQVLEAQN